MKNRTKAATTTAITAAIAMNGFAIIIDVSVEKACPAFDVAVTRNENTELPAFKPFKAIFAILDSFERTVKACVTLLISPPAIANTRITLPAFPKPETIPPVTPMIFPAFVMKPPKAVVAGPITGDRPIKPLVTLAMLLSELLAHSNVLFIISSKELLKPPFAAIALLDNASQLPPNCSIFEPRFCCISLA